MCKANRTKEQNITHEYLLSQLTYDETTGYFHWKNFKGRPRAKIDLPAGCKGTNGRWVIRLKGNVYTAHRLAWFYVYKAWPQYTIDHIDKDCTNNRIANLRDVTNAVNHSNRTKSPKNTSGVTGVCFNRKFDKWVARIWVNQRQIFLGNFSDKNDAIRVRREAEKKYNFTND